MSDNKLQDCGYLEIIIGPMFSSKTTTILEIYKQCKFCDISVFIINHSMDKRYHETMVSSHDKIMAPCLQANKLNDVWLNNNNNNVDCNSKYYTEQVRLKNSDVILINEGQFFEDLYEVVNQMIDCKKKSVCLWIRWRFREKEIWTNPRFNSNL